MSDRTAAEASIRALVERWGTTEESLKILALVLDRAQNGPPDGMADGTIDAATFDVLRKAERAGLEYQLALAAAARHVGADPSVARRRKYVGRKIG